MSDGPVTLSRKDWHTVWDMADQANESCSNLCALRDALEELGMTRAVATIERAQSEVADCRLAITKILLISDDRMTASLEAIAIVHKSNPNKEA